MYMLCNDEEVFIPNTSAKSMPFRMIIIELFMMYVHVFKNMRNLLISAKVGLSMLKKKRLIKFSNGTICSLLWYVFHNMYTGILKWVHVTLRFWLFRGINYNFGFIKTWIGVRNLLFLSKKNFNAEMFNILCALYQISKGDQNEIIISHILKVGKTWLLYVQRFWYLFLYSCSIYWVYRINQFPDWSAKWIDCRF